MQNVANTVLLQKPDHSLHDMSSQTLTTTVIGRITPVNCIEVVPGDTITIGHEMLLKFMPLGTPIMQGLTAYIHSFYIPFRVMWKNWKYFIAQNLDPYTGQIPLHPLISTIDSATYNNVNYITRYLGLTDTVNDVSPFPFLAYQRIYNEYYRHEKIHDDLENNLFCPDGNFVLPTTAWLAARYRTWKDTYFSSALPSPQQGDAAQVNIFQDVPVALNAGPIAGVANKYGIIGGVNPGPTTATMYDRETGNPTNIDANAMYAATSELSVSVNDLIELSRLQEFLVRNNIAGNRYNEFILAHFGERVPDLRVDRPEYLTGCKTPVQIQELLNSDSSQGTQSGQAAAYARGGGSHYKITEHGLIMSLLTVIPSESYCNATQRHLWKNKHSDYYLPVFDQMGEQEVYNKELHVSHIDPDGTFGYLPRYSEYRLPFIS